MKRFAAVAIAAMTFIAPLGAAGAASADNGRHNGWDRHDNDHHRSDRRDYRRDDRGDRRSYHRDRYHDTHRQAWNHSQYNGYWRQGRFHYGPPPTYYGDATFGYRQFRRGERLPSYYANRYHQVDYRAYRVAPPPRGYHYVRNDNNGELLLIGITTGIILGAILANN